jgi:aspartate/methionine/tyrosine aminotransferase
VPHRFATRVREIEPFLAMEVMERAFVLERAGTPVIHLEIGEPDFAPPQAAIEACHAAVASPSFATRSPRSTRAARAYPFRPNG